MRAAAPKKPTPRRHTTRAPQLAMPTELFEARTTPDVVTVPARTVLALEGQGAPEAQAFQECVRAIYGIAYTLKFARKRAGTEDFKIGPLEARWWSAEPAEPIFKAPRATWRWRLRLAAPPTVSEPELRHAITLAVEKKGGALEGSVAAARVTIETLPTMRYGRVLHLGPYAEEGPSFGRIVQAVTEAGLAPLGAHIEVYLNDPRRTKPDKLKTVLLLELASEG